jgi:uncharacterized protein (DUF697 family)
MELAIELLEVATEAELEQLLGKLLNQAGIKAVGSSAIRPLGGVLKTVAKAALPFVATAAGTFFGGPAGGAIGTKLGSLVSQALEAEATGMTAADRDLEKCRQFVRMAGNAAKAAALAPTGTNPTALAQNVGAGEARKAAYDHQEGWHRAKAAASASPVPYPSEPQIRGGERPKRVSRLPIDALQQLRHWPPDTHGRSIVIVNC